MIGTILALLGAFIITISLTLVRYNWVAGNSHTFAIYQSTGSLCLICSTYWHFHIGVLIINTYITLICFHTILRNSRRKRV